MNQGDKVRDVVIPANGVQLQGFLGVPEGALGVVIFAHGSGSGRLSPRNSAVAGSLQEAGLATLLVDLLTDTEATDRRSVFDIGLLAQRLLLCTTWINHEPATSHLPMGYFGASTGGGAALVAAAQSGSVIRAVVSRGGRPDLAGAYLPMVRCPTLLIVGGHDQPVIRLNEEARDQMRAATGLVIVPGATHLFEEPGALEEVSRLARDWFLKYLQAETLEEW